MSRTVKRCRRCNKPATEARPISRRGNCPACGKRALVENARIQSAGGVLVDPEAKARWVEGMTRAIERESANAGGGA